MMHRSLTSAGVAVLLAILGLTVVPVAGQAPAPAAKSGNGGAAKAYVQAKTPDGQPDLSGYWTVSTYIPFERPKNVTKEFYTPEEMAKIEKEEAAIEENHREAKPGDPEDVHYDRTQFGLTRSQIRFARNLRTALIFDPRDGRIPPQTAEAQKRNGELAAARKRRGDLDSVQTMAFDDRCVMMPGHQPPIFHSGYFPNYQIIQSPGYVTILSERLHDARIIPLDGRPFSPSSVRSWMGISRGHWEGNTLVVETRNTNGKIQAAASGPMSQQAVVGGSEDMRVVERFTRVHADAIEYRFTVEDPKTWEKPFSGEVPFVKMEIQGPFFEHACHEGNRAPSNMLSVARFQEKKAAEAAAKKTSN